MPERPEIVCLCGSMRFADELHAAARELTLAGVIVLAPMALARPGSPDATTPLTADQRVLLSELHLYRIDLADRVLVVSPGGYLGDSTRREIAHARATGKPVSFTEPQRSAR